MRKLNYGKYLLIIFVVFSPAVSQFKIKFKFLLRDLTTSMCSILGCGWDRQPPYMAKSCECTESSHSQPVAGGLARCSVDQKADSS